MTELAANLIAGVHIAYFLFIVAGFVVFLPGIHGRERWIRNAWFRLGHVAAIYIVLFEEVTGLPCILNLAEWSLRTGGSGIAEAQAGAGGVLDLLLFHTISPLALDIFYWTAGGLALVLLWKAPPRFRGSGSGGTEATKQGR